MIQQRTIQLVGSSGLLQVNGRLKLGEVLTVTVMDRIGDNYYVNITPREPIFETKQTHYEVTLGQSVILEYDLYDPDGDPEKRKVFLEVDEEAIQVEEEHHWQGAKVKALKPGVRVVRVVAECEFGTTVKVFEVTVPWPTPKIVGQTEFRTPLGVPLVIKQQVQSLEGDLLTHSIKKAPGTKASVNERGEITFIPKVEGDVVIHSHVDGNGGKDTIEYVIHVDPPLLPKLEAIPGPIRVKVGEVIVVPVGVEWPNDHRPSVFYNAVSDNIEMVIAEPAGEGLVRLGGYSPGTTLITYEAKVREGLSVPLTFEAECYQPEIEQTVELLDAATAADAKGASQGEGGEEQPAQPEGSPGEGPAEEAGEGPIISENAP